MLCFDDGTQRFNYRVAGVAVVDDKVLIHRGEGEPFWTLPGGRGEFFEFSRDTLLREMREELMTDVEIGRLLWIAENFYQNVSLRYHELAWYYEMMLPEFLHPHNRPEPFFGDDNGLPVEFRWQPLDRLRELTVQPKFLYDGLHELPQSVCHINEE